MKYTMIRETTYEAREGRNDTFLANVSPDQLKGILDNMSDQEIVDKTPSPMETQSILVDGREYVPISALAMSVGNLLVYDEKDNVVYERMMG